MVISLFYLIFFSSNRTRLSKGSSSWIDDYFDWLILDEACCRINSKTNASCLSDRMSYIIIWNVVLLFRIQFGLFCSILAKLQPDPDCKFCKREFHIENGVKRPKADTFDRYIPVFLQDIPTENCAKAGKPAYSNVRFNPLRMKYQTKYSIFY